MISHKEAFDSSSPYMSEEAVAWAESTRLQPDLRNFQEASFKRSEHPPLHNMYEFSRRHAFFEQYSNEPLLHRHALARAHAMKNENVCLLPDERLVGMVYHYGREASPAPVYDDMADTYDFASHIWHKVGEAMPELNSFANDPYIVTSYHCPGHVGWNYQWVLQDGVEGLLAHIDAAYPGADSDGKDYLDCMRISLQGMLDWNDRHIEAMQQKLAQASGTERQRLEKLIEICGHVPRHGARNFYEAVQSFYFVYLSVMLEQPNGGNGPGRLDYHLWPYLSSDLATGRCSIQDARDLIDELFIRMDERIRPHDGWVETIVVGGCQIGGSPSITPLSHLMIESIGSLRQTHPSVYIRMPENAPKSFLQLATRDIINGDNRAQIVSDKAVITAMTRRGMAYDDATMYMCGGCMEISPQGMNGDLLFSGFLNLPKTLELVLTGGRCLKTGEQRLPHLTQSLADYATFDDFFEAFRTELERELNMVFRGADIASEAYSRLRPAFLLSSMISDCITRGRDLNGGGARYHDYGFTPLGLPNVADSMMAVKAAVYDLKIVEPQELLRALETNFEGCAGLRKRLITLPKYGQGHMEADEMMEKVIAAVCNIFDSYTTMYGGHAKTMMMSFVMAPITGATLGASPDGRLAGRPIAQSITPQSSSMTSGITAAINSSTAIPQTFFSGGATTMWDLDPDFATPQTVQALLITFLQLGGQMFQGNMTSVKDLLHAQAHPEEHQNLMVRIGGYSGRFVNLDKALQEEIITRHRHNQ